MFAFNYLKSSQYKIILAIAVPMIISNITTPLLGLVDTAILGHLPHPHMLAGVALATAVISSLVWLCGFLRMSITGLTAQATEQPDASTKTTVLLYQGVFLALLLSLPVYVFHTTLLEFALSLSDTTKEAAQSATSYFSIRILAFPASLINLVLTGWLLAQGQAKTIMFMQININLINLFLDLVTVYGFNMGVEGVALASMVAEWTGTVLLLRPVLQRLDSKGVRSAYQALSLKRSKAFLTTNTDILLRSLLLQSSLIFMTFQGARFGENIVAANAVLMNFLIFIALGLDGIAYAAEVLCGRHFGAHNKQKLHETIIGCGLLTFYLAVFYTLLFAFSGTFIIQLMTDLDSIRATANQYLIYIILLPACAAGCFLLDGIFVGLADGKAMRNSMAISVLVVYFPLFFMLQELENHALWLALLAMMLMRSITLTWRLRLYI
ncbi:MATE family efflux transporter [Gayadomonas joobiniege]|uniref:MATE family efflux transporter n=1 Tax=Gayadomonas joobiniege TaxID=1234606 RepID=UPI0003768433|nr:MATE family efflux transporter [Gayadomonas joobiniege]